MPGVNGDWSQLKAASRALADLSTDAFRREVNSHAADAALTMIERGFTNARDPYAHTWSALRYRHGRPLDKTGALRGSFRAHPSAKGFVITAADYAKYQNGTRRMVPTGALGAAWEQALNRAIDDVVKRYGVR